MASRIIFVSRFDVKHGLPNGELLMRFFFALPLFRVIAAVATVTVYWLSVRLAMVNPVLQAR